MPKGRRRKLRTARGRARHAGAPFRQELHSIDHRLTAIEGHLREIAVITGAKKRSILLGPHLQDDLEHDILQRFLDGQPHRTSELAPDIGKDRRQVLRILRRINRRVKRTDGVEPFQYDPAKRTWQLGLDIIDRKELR